jgi:hypothetical protein
LLLLRQAVLNTRVPFHLGAVKFRDFKSTSRLLRGLDLFVGTERRTRAGVNVSCWLVVARAGALATGWGPGSGRFPGVKTVPTQTYLTT